MRSIWAPKPGATKRAPPGEFIGEPFQIGLPFRIPYAREGHASSCPGSTFALQRHSIRMHGPPCSPSKTQHQLSRPPPRSATHRFTYIVLSGKHIHRNILQNPNRARRSAPLQVGRVNGCNSAFSRQAATRFGTILPSRTNGFNAAHAEGGILLTRATTRKLQECRGEAALPASASLSPHESTKNLSSQCWASGRKHQKNGA